MVSSIGGAENVSPMLESHSKKVPDFQCNMAGKVNGVGARIQREYPKALPFWCAAHQLNRCVVQSCVIPAIRNMMSDADEVVKFFEWSPAKELALLNKAETTLTNVVTKTKLKELCKTRWVERHDAFQTFLDMFPAIVATLEDYANKPNTRIQGVASASSLYKTVTDFDFLITIIIVQKCLCYISGLSKSLQERSLDVGRALEQVLVVKDALEETRREVEEFHLQCFQQAEAVANDLDIPVSKPRTCGRQTKRNNVPSETPEDYYRKSVTVPFLDHLIQEINERFSDLHDRASVGLKLVPSMMNSPVKATELEYFASDLPDKSVLESELHQWFLMWNRRSQKPSSIADALELCDGNFYPNIKIILRICATFPITSCECERSISVLRLLKTYLRSTMGQDRLTSLALMYIHRDIPVDSREIVIRFANKNPRRILLPNILSECSM